MATSRTYGEACGIPRALDRVGERWALLVVRELMLGPKRFTDLKAGLSHASPNVLAQRLRELEQAGVVRKRRLPPPAASQVYELTDWGSELEPVLVALGRWGARAPLDPEYMGMSVDSHIVSLATLFDPELAGDLEATWSCGWARTSSAPWSPAARSTPAAARPRRPTRCSRSTRAR